MKATTEQKKIKNVGFSGCFPPGVKRLVLHFSSLVGIFRTLIT